MAEEWFYARDGQQFGPVSAAQLKQLAAGGQLTPTDLVWKPGMTGWTPAGQIRGLLGGSAEQRALAAAAPAANEPAAPASAASGGLGPVRADGAAGEPWFYGFIEGYTRFFLTVGIACAFLVLLLFLGATLRAMADVPLGAAEIAFLVGRLLAALLAFAAWVLGLLFTAALLLLAVDAGRNLRTLRKNSSGQ